MSRWPTISVHARADHKESAGRQHAMKASFCSPAHANIAAFAAICLCYGGIMQFLHIQHYYMFLQLFEQITMNKFAQHLLQDFNLLGISRVDVGHTGSWTGTNADGESLNVGGSGSFSQTQTAL